MIDIIIQFITEHDDSLIAATNYVAAIALTTLFIVGLRARKTFYRHSISLNVLYTGFLIQTAGWALQRWFYGVVRTFKHSGYDEIVGILINAGEYVQVLTWIALFGVIVSISPFFPKTEAPMTMKNIVRNILILFGSAVLLFFIIVKSIIIFSDTWTG